MTTLTAFWQALALTLDDLETVTLTGGDTTHATSNPTWVNAATGISTNRYAGAWFYNITNASQAKIVSYDNTTGIQTVAPAMTANANTNAGAITRLFPVRPVVGEETDYRTLANRALERMMIERKDTISITTATSYSLSAFPSLDRPERLRLIREPAPTTGYPPVDSMFRRWRVVPAVPTASLEVDIPFGIATGSITVEWMSPATRYISVASVWAESTAGLVNETDEAQPSVAEALPFLRREAAMVLIARAQGAPSGHWVQMLQQAEADIAKSRYLDRTQMTAPMPAERAA